MRRGPSMPLMTSARRGQWGGKGGVVGLNRAEGRPVLCGHWDIKAEAPTLRFLLPRWSGRKKEQRQEEAEEVRNR